MSTKLKSLKSLLVFIEYLVALKEQLLFPCILRTVCGENNNEFFLVHCTVFEKDRGYNDP